MNRKSKWVKLAVAIGLAAAAGVVLSVLHPASAMHTFDINTDGDGVLSPFRAILSNFS